MNLATLPKERTVDPSTLEKARHMLRRYSLEYVSDYLGLVPSQVEAIHRNMPSGKARGRARKVVA